MPAKFGAYPPEDFQDRLFKLAGDISRWIESEEFQHANGQTTHLQAPILLAVLAREILGSVTHVKSPNILLPLKSGFEVSGHTEVTGDIVNFMYRKFPVHLRDKAQYTEQTGTLAIIAIEGSEPEEARQSAWKKVIRESSKPDHRNPSDFINQAVSPVVVPINEDAHFTQLDNSFPLFMTTGDVIGSKPPGSPQFDYQVHVNIIHTLLQGGFPDHRIRHQSLLPALAIELRALNTQYPHLGKQVWIDSDHLYTPSQSTFKGHIPVNGPAAGVFTKFVYEKLPTPSGIEFAAKAAVQAVIYPDELADVVYSGKITPYRADRLRGTLYVRLDEPHELIPLEAS